ncbi:hypothetical protein KKI24_24640 [bacterium]|nr:hypothetical protein [bacterium]
MFPGVFEWVWDIGHLVFMGIFWLVITVLISGLVVAISRSISAANRELLEYDDTQSEP